MVIDEHARFDFSLGDLFCDARAGFSEVEYVGTAWDDARDDVVAVFRYIDAVTEEERAEHPDILTHVIVGRGEDVLTPITFEFDDPELLTDDDC